MDIAVVGCGVSLTLDAKGICTAARVSLGAVAARPLLVRRRRQGADRHQGRRRRAGRSSTPPRSAACRPIDDKRGTKEYRIKVAGVLARRAAQIALERARKA